MGKFKQVETQFIAAVGDPQAKSGKGAEAWGIWRVDPGPRGVRLQHYKELEAAGGTARAGWKFDKSDWWVEEHGMIMPAPEHLPAGKYKVVWLNRQRYPSHRLPEGGVVLTVTHDRWTLSDGATLHDGTRPSLTLPWLSLQSQN